MIVTVNLQRYNSKILSVQQWISLRSQGREGNTTNLNDHMKYVYFCVNSTNDHLIYIFISFQFFCDYCGAIFKTKSNLKGHLSNVHFPSEKVFKCDLCVPPLKEKVYKSKSILYMHMKRVHINKKKHAKIVNGTFKCTVCIPPLKERAYMSKNALQKHVRRFHLKK